MTYTKALLFTLSRFVQLLFETMLNKVIEQKIDFSFSKPFYPTLPFSFSTPFGFGRGGGTIEKVSLVTQKAPPPPGYVTVYYISL